MCILWWIFVIAFLELGKRTDGFHSAFLRNHGNRRLVSLTSRKIPITCSSSDLNASMKKNSLELSGSVGMVDAQKADFAVSWLEKANNLFPLWVLSASLLGFAYPATLTWFVPYITPALTLTMIGMGMTLTLADFSRVLASWPYVLLGFVAQYLIMPLSAVFSAKFFNLPPDIASGLILVGCAPGGTASNLVTLIAKADLALSILMTTASTMAAVFMTPLLVTKYAGSIVAVKSADLVLSTLQVVLLPVVLGLFLNTKYPATSKRVSSVTPSLSVLLVALICGSISASNSHILRSINSLNLILSIVLLHSLGFGIGYVFAHAFRSGEERARTISIETGMQNSALAVVLAQHFPNPAMSALPGAISATCHSIIGSLLAAFWRYQGAREEVVPLAGNKGGPCDKFNIHRSAKI